MPLNHVVLASGAVVAVSVAMATVIAVYESPEFRRYTEDVRRRIAMVFDSFNEGGSSNTPFRPPRFNRPEDADGFMLSRRGNGNGNGAEVDADEESRRKQREELLYWNAVRLEKEKEKQSQSQSRASVDDGDGGVFDEKQDAGSSRPGARHRGSSFDDFLRPDEHGEKGSYVFNSGADIGNGAGLRHRGAKSAAPPAVAAAAAAAAAATAVLSSGNPFVDDSSANSRQLPPANLDIMSDIYSAPTPDREERPVLVSTPTPTPTPTDTPATLVDLDSTSPPLSQAPEPFEQQQTTLSRPVPVPVSEPEAPLAAPQDERHEVFASIQAWAHDSSRDFYSPLPVTPVAPMSEPELISEGGFSSDFSDAGELTPLEGMSVAGSAEDVGNHFNHTGNGEGVQELVWAHPESEARAFDVMSESEGMPTPASWSEVGSVISESEAFPMRR